MAFALFFPAGLIVGSFLNVLIRRLPLGEPIAASRSRCPLCRRVIFWHDNIPLLSFAWLRGRCRHCRKPISWRYPAVELLTGFLFSALGRRWQEHGFWLAAPLAASAVLIAIAFIDWDTFLIPDVLSLGLLGGGILASFWNPYFGGGPAWARLARSLAGATVGFCVCWGVAAAGEWIFKKEAMGGGDVKLLAAVGAWTGIRGALDCLVLASFLGSIYGIGLILRGRLKRREPIPFGPFLSAAAVFNLFYLLPLENLFR